MSIYGHNKSMYRLTREQRVSVIKALCEGCSVNATVRMTRVSKMSVLKLLVDMGRVCLNHEDAALRGLYVREIEADEIWGFNHCKAKTLPRAKAAPVMAGDCWTWYAFDRHSKAILSWMMGDRDESHAHAFMHDLASRLIGRPQLSTDALNMYQGAVFDAFARLGVDYGQIHKVYQNVTVAPGREDVSKCIGCDKKPIFGSPRQERISTSGIERANLTLRMSQRRWTRKTNAHSKKFENMQAAFALHAAFYNWCRPHATHKGKTPAMVLGVTDRVWAVEDLVALLEAEEAAIIGTEKNRRGPYRKSRDSD